MDISMDIWLIIDIYIYIDNLTIIHISQRVFVEICRPLPRFCSAWKVESVVDPLAVVEALASKAPREARDVG